MQAAHDIGAVCRSSNDSDACASFTPGLQSTSRYNKTGKASRVGLDDLTEIYVESIDASVERLGQDASEITGGTPNKMPTHGHQGIRMSISPELTVDVDLRFDRPPGSVES